VQQNTEGRDDQQELLHLQVVAVFFVTFLIVIAIASLLMSNKVRPSCQEIPGRFS